MCLRTALPSNCRVLERGLLCTPDTQFYHRVASLLSYRYLQPEESAQKREWGLHRGFRGGMDDDCCECLSFHGYSAVPCCFVRHGGRTLYALNLCIQSHVWLTIFCHICPPHREPICTGVTPSGNGLDVMRTFHSFVINTAESKIRSLFRVPLSRLYGKGKEGDLKWISQRGG